MRECTKVAKWNISPPPTTKKNWKLVKFSFLASLSRIWLETSSLEMNLALKSLLQGQTRLEYLWRFNEKGQLSVFQKIRWICFGILQIFFEWDQNKLKMYSWHFSIITILAFTRHMTSNCWIEFLVYLVSGGRGEIFSARHIIISC